jgi:hypothetical protein
LRRYIKVLFLSMHKPVGDGKRVQEERSKWWTQHLQDCMDRLLDKLLLLDAQIGAKGTRVASTEEHTWAYITRLVQWYTTLVSQYHKYYD